MARVTPSAEQWQQVYAAFQNVNFAAYDYATVKQSLIQYLKTYFPEQFNNFIETDELMPIIEAISYVCELMIYKNDVNTHENFISTASLKESVLKLAKLVAYRASRNRGASGFVKITSVTTNEPVFDSLGNNLARKKIIWGDINNINWREQFIAAMNRIMNTRFGSVDPASKVQIDDMIYELYDLKNIPVPNGVMKYSAIGTDRSFDMELVPVSLDPSNGQLIERRPENGSKFSLLYATDGLGDFNPETGFFVMTKQGVLRKSRVIFDGRTPNMTYDINVPNINDDDVWINNVDEASGAIISSGINGAKLGEWNSVDTVNQYNIAMGGRVDRNVYEIETLDGDEVRLVFGDGVLSNIPSGMFDVWYRTSANTNDPIPQSSINDIPLSIRYIGADGTPYTLSFTVSLIAPIQNSSASEDIEHIRVSAPNVYYTQDRMVSAADHNKFMLSDPSILKLNAVNRAYSGESRYMFWHDPNDNYESVKLFGNDLAIYVDDRVVNQKILNEPFDPSYVLRNVVEVALSDEIIYNKFLLNTGKPGPRRFDTTTLDALAQELRVTSWPQNKYLCYHNNTWYFDVSPTNLNLFVISAKVSGGDIVGWVVQIRGCQLVSHSDEMAFWNASDMITRSIDTTSYGNDTVTIIEANLNALGTAQINGNLKFKVSDVRHTKSGVLDPHELVITSTEVNQYGMPKNELFFGLYDATYNYTVYPGQNITVITLPREYHKGNGEIAVFGADVWVEDPNVNAGERTKYIHVLDRVSVPKNIQVDVIDYVYLRRESLDSNSWTVFEPSLSTIRDFYIDSQLPPSKRLIDRRRGRSGLNFLWMHRAAQNHVIDPSPTNIHDISIIQRGYYEGFVKWLYGDSPVKPSMPSTTQLHVDYGAMLKKSMMSDTIVLKSGKLVPLFGSNAIPQLQASIRAIRNPTSTLTDTTIKSAIVDTIREYFDINDWSFGETFYATDMSHYIHTKLGGDVLSVVLVPKYPDNYFGDLYEVRSAIDEIPISHITVDDIELIQQISATTIRQF